VFGRYEQFIRPNSDDDEHLFDKHGFLASEPEQSRPFLIYMLDSQAFLRFARETALQNSHVVRYFAESIHAKTNRSFLTIRKKPTPFLSSAHGITKTVVAIAPDTTRLNQG